MKNVRANTNKANWFIHNYKNATKSTLGECYGNYSTAKAYAYRRCMDLMNSLDGWGQRICSFNSMMFTFAFQFVDPETGVIRLAYITRDNDYVTDML